MISSLLDNDFYQFTMAHAIHHQGDNRMLVRYEFRNRTFAVPLATRIDLDKLRTQIKYVQELQFTNSDVEYLGSLGYFSDEWLKSLPALRLPDVEVGSDNGHLTMNYEGEWGAAIFWETILLSLVNELYFEQFGNYNGEGVARLSEKIEYLRERQTLNVVEFGTRRRFSAAWQHYVMHELLNEIPDLVIGTSNVGLARTFGVRPIGTMAHQMTMVYTAARIWMDVIRRTNSYGQVPSEPPIEQTFAAATNQVLALWADAYEKHPELMTALPDTYTTERFIKWAKPELISKFNAFRQDSGDPHFVGMQLHGLGRLIGQDRPRLIFSDGLDVRSMSVLDDTFGVQDQIAFGWGTNLTNDLGYEPLSIVIKPCAVKLLDKWVPCVKISDEPAKATGDPEAVELYRHQLGL